MAEYWYCVIGPVERSELNDGMKRIFGKIGGADLLPRRAAINAVENIVGYQPAHCWSAWGVSEERKEAILMALRDKGNISE